MDMSSDMPESDMGMRVGLGKSLSPIFPSGPSFHRDKTGKDPLCGKYERSR